MSGAHVGGSRRILITGADGFIGRHFVHRLASGGIDYRTAVRARNQASDAACHYVVGDIGPKTAWQAALDGVDIVVHLAARAHVLREVAADPRTEFMRVNAEGTAALVSAAVAAGVKRVVYLSSIGVHGSKTSESPFTEASPLRPHSLYAESKLAGEAAARAAAGSVTQLVVLRPPLVYGSGVKANFLRLMRWIDRRWPLPLGAVANKRSLVNVWNLCDLLLVLAEHQVAPSRPWVVSDGEDLSSGELAKRVGMAMSKEARLVSVPVRVLRACGAATGRRVEIDALCDSLEVDMTATCRELQWKPALSLNEGLMRTAAWYGRANSSLPTNERWDV